MNIIDYKYRFVIHLKSGDSIEWLNLTQSEVDWLNGFMLRAQPRGWQRIAWEVMP